MFTFSIKIQAKKIAVCCAAVCIAACGFVAAKEIINRKVLETSVNAQAFTKLPKAKINDDRIKIAESLGWEVDSEPLEIEEILIPDKFDEVYSKYNELQKTMGFDLERHRGDKCRRYVYKVKNYGGDEEVVLNMLIYKDKLIGGDVSSRALGGFMHSLKNDQRDASPQHAATSVTLAQYTAKLVG